MNPVAFRTPILCVLLIVCAAGCANSVPAGRYQAFSAASDTVSVQLADTFARIEKREREFAVMAAPDQPLTADSFNLDSGGLKVSIDGQLSARAAALAVIVNYAKALDALANKDFAAGVDQSSQELAASVRGISGVNPATANLFGSVIDGLANVTTNSMRKSALKNIMGKGQPALEAISSQFQLDSAKIAKYVDHLRDSYLAHAQHARPKYGTWERYRFDAEVADTLDEFKQINAALNAASTTIQKLPEAHRQILQSLDDNARPMDALHDVISESQRLRGFYQNLSSTN